MKYADAFCDYKEVFSPKHAYIFTGPCIVTGKPYSVKVFSEDLYDYRQGMLIQQAFPYLSIDDREFLMSGYSPEGWKKAFGDNEDQE